jgi:hypothetical protein
MSSLGPDARALLDATSDGDDPTEVDAARVRAKLEQRFLLSAAGVAAATSAATGAKAGATLGGSTSAGAAAVPAAGAGAASLPGAGAALGGSALGSTSMAVGKALLVVALAGGAVGTGIEIQGRLQGARPEPAPTAMLHPSEAAVPAASSSAVKPASGLPAASRPPQAAPRAPAAAASLVTPRREPVAGAEAVAKQAAPAAQRREDIAAHPERIRSSAPRPLPASRSRSSAPASLATPAVSKREVTPPSRPAARDSILDEAALLRAARSAIARGDGARALSHLDEHAATFPRGALQEEAAAARVFALCAAGRAPEARTAAADFLALRASSPLAAQVRQACARPSGTPLGSPRK